MIFFIKICKIFGKQNRTQFLQAKAGRVETNSNK